MADPVLALRNLAAWYGESQALHGIDLDIAEGEVVTLLGRNGAGKTTILRAIMGLMPRATGSIRLRGEEILGLAPHRIARRGIALCPEERGIFASLTVRENFLLPPILRPGGLTEAECAALFPVLRERGATQGTRLSGGEQQMLAITRILRTGARLLLLDEPTEGLAPVIVERIGAVIRQARDRGFTILLVEQNFAFAASLADRHIVIEHGRAVDCVTGGALAASMDRLHTYLGV